MFPPDTYSAPMLHRLFVIFLTEKKTAAAHSYDAEGHLALPEGLLSAYDREMERQALNGKCCVEGSELS